MELFVARRPIFDRRRHVITYHFLTPGETEPSATPHVLRLGIEHLGNDKTVMVDHAAEVAEPNLTDFPRDRFILNVKGEDSSSVMEFAKSASSHDVRVAVPQHLFERHEGDLSGLARYLVVDPNGKYDSVLAAKVASLKKLGFRLIGDNVNDYATFNKCVAMGFEYFSGSFIAKPAVSGRRTVASSRLTLIQLMTRLQDPTVTVDEIEHMIAMDANLGFRLLRLVNSASQGVREEVDSLRAAILLLGTIKIANLVSLLAYQKIDDKPDALTQIAMLRARSSEMLAVGLGFDRPDRFFTAGLLSVLEAMFDVPMNDLVDQLPLTNELSEALTDTFAPDNEIAFVLRNVLALEAARFDDIDPLAVPHLRKAYAEALAWSDQSIQP